MYRPAQFGGYVALLLTAGALLAGSLVASVELPTGTVGVQVGLVLTAAVAGVLEHKRLLGPFETTGFDRADVTNALAVVAGAVVTYVLSVHAGFGPVLASALVGLLAGLALPRIDVPAYCGSFVGMASPVAFPSLESVVLAGLIAGLGFVATTETFGGVGGKLGTLAFFGCLTAAAFVGLEFDAAGAPQWDLVSLIVPVGAAGAAATVVSSVRLEWGPVVGSAVVGVVAGVVFPLAVPELGATLAAVAFCASFVGMSNPARLSLGAVVLAGGLCGVVFLVVTPAFPGAGGKLGTTAFVSCLAVLGGRELYDGVVSVLSWVRKTAETGV
ncbi:hypothetical protein [Natronorubrum sulfidifaciens]|uniref:Uncharacterized protein n=1 Tax=Natronorubrum sulfidifaciens JCM 14089 TaxID=1230460 RepID=L9W6V0_9EURY|nr:hypothetical protein [Natronorubrum sulfidifaciens]ELY45199.1 hypothetical protein C495_09660 [Natronorubrum sulfidifaciens JCM 14089]